MRSVGAIMVAVALGVALGAQTTSSSSSLAGIVLNDQRTPVACARVVIRGAGQMVSTRTGPDGRFAFTKLSFRVRWIAVNNGGFVTLNDRSFPDPANLTLRSSAGALLGGILLDEHHQPIRNVEVTALTRQPQYGRPRFVPVANDVTEADGSYCLQVPVATRTREEVAGTGPPAAGDDGRREFLVGVIPTGTWLPHPAWAVTVVPLTGRPPTYFPSVTTSAEARVLRPQPGEARRDLNFALQSARLTRIEGDILGAYLPALGASDVVLEPPDEDVAIYRRASPDANGHFVFSDVMPGDYTVRLFPSNRMDGRGGWGIKPVTVRGEPALHVAVSWQHTQILAGLTAFSGAATMLPGVRILFTVSASRVSDLADRFPPSFYPSPFYSSDGPGQFAVTNLMPGQYELTVSGAEERGWHLDAITIPAASGDAGGERRDVTKTPFIVEPGSDTFGARIELSPEATRIAGVIHGDNGRPIPADVIAYPVDERKWPAGLAGASARPEIVRLPSQPDGTFAIRGLPAGDYLVVAIQAAPAIDAGLLAALQPYATHVTIGPRPPDLVRVTLTRLVWPPRHPTVGSWPRSKQDVAGVR